MWKLKLDAKLNCFWKLHLWKACFDEMLFIEFITYLSMICKTIQYLYFCQKRQVEIFFKKNQDFLS